MLNERLQDRVLYVGRAKKDTERLAQLMPLSMRGEAGVEQAKELGNLFGFPSSAVEAYCTNKASGGKLANEVLLDDPTYLEIKNEDSTTFLSFRLSKAHWKEELNTARTWAAAVKRRAPHLYERCVEEHREWLKRERGKLAN